MRRLAIVAALVAGLASFAAPASATFGGECDGAVDTNCHGGRVCGPDDLDCNLVPCRLWVAVQCVL